MNKSKQYTVVLPAAGVGSRMQAAIAKQYLLLNEQTVIEHTIARLLSHPAIERVIVVLHPNDHHFSELACAKDSRVETSIGGKERVDSVLKGLKAVAQSCTPEFDGVLGNALDGTLDDTLDDTLDKRCNNLDVLVHDAARPCITHEELDLLIEQYEQSKLVQQQSSSSSAIGAILATPVVDTLKQSRKTKANAHTTIAKTIDRRLLWQAQTPQMFPLTTLIDAIELALKDNINITDEASAMEHIGAVVTLVEGRSSNIKITRPSDLSLAEFYLKFNNKET